MNVAWLWDKNLTIEEIKKILDNETNERFIEIAGLLLSRKNDPQEIFNEYIDKNLFVKNWHKIRKLMRKDKWSNPRIDYWQAVYEKLVNDFKKNGIKIEHEVREPSANCKEAGNTIKLIRKQSMLTQKDLAKRLGVSQQLISRIEGGEENISIRTFERIMKELKTKINLDFKISVSPSLNINAEQIQNDISRNNNMVFQNSCAARPVMISTSSTIGSVFYNK